MYTKIGYNIYTIINIYFYGIKNVWHFKKKKNYIVKFVNFQSITDASNSYNK